MERKTHGITVDVVGGRMAEIVHRLESYKKKEKKKGWPPTFPFCATDSVVSSLRWKVNECVFLLSLSILIK